MPEDTPNTPNTEVEEPVDMDAESKSSEVLDESEIDEEVDEEVDEK